MSGQYVFGPVASRRLGVSLGINLFQDKICSQNCIYCEAGATNCLTMERKEYALLDTVLQQLDAALSSGVKPDYITFSGTGEPTLHSGIGRVIRYIKEKYPACKVCVLTNSMHLSDPAVRAEIEPADLVIPSLDASSETEFLKINRPCRSLKFEDYVAGLECFCRERSGRTELEVFLVPGVNDSAESLNAFAAIIRHLKVDKVQLNTLDRGGCVDWIQPAPEETMERFAKVFAEFVPVTIASRRNNH